MLAYFYKNYTNVSFAYTNVSFSYTNVSLSINIQMVLINKDKQVFLLRYYKSKSEFYS